VAPVNQEAEERLLVEAAQKDRSRFAELYERNFRRVYAFVARRVRDRAKAEDVTSDVFQKALANLHRFEWRGAPFAAWLYRIAANAIADDRDRDARERRLPEPDPPAEVAFEEIDQAARIYRLVDELPTDQRRVVQMRFAEEKSIREIALELKRSEGAVKQLQFRALQSLKARMRDSNV
jgi:RNA polymerase sigma-70 factor (ECF subfamily)